MSTALRRIEMEVEGMTCPSCEIHVTERLSSVTGVKEAAVRYPDGTAHLTVEGGTPQTALVEALSGTPYSARIVGEVPAVADAVSAGPENAVGGAGATAVASSTGAVAPERVGAPSWKGTGARDRDGAPYDLAVVGAGSAGFAAAIKVAEAGGRVVMIQSGTLGGTCVNVGCVPSKAVIRAAEAQHVRAHHPFDGIARSDDPVDWNGVRRGKDDLVGALRQAKYADVLAAYPGITLIEGWGTFDADGRLHLSDGSAVPARNVVVTTGSSPSIPDIPGLKDAGYLDSTALLDVGALPASLAVLGAGSVGLELAQAYARLGVGVTILARSRLLSKGDPEVSDELARHLRDEGLEVLTGVAVEKVERAGSMRRVHARTDDGPVTVEVEAILVATGRRPNTAGMGLEEAGVELGPHGEIVVDERMRTALPHVYAAGDVTGEPMHVYVAAHAAAIAAENALGGDATLDLSVLPLVTFTDPGVASVGLTEEQARARGIEPLVSTLPMEHVPRALAARDTRGFVKLVADASTRRIIGAHIVAHEGWEMIMEPAMAIRFRLTIEDLTTMLHPYLTLSEGVKLAALTFEKDVAKLSCCAV